MVTQRTYDGLEQLAEIEIQRTYDGLGQLAEIEIGESHLFPVHPNEGCAGLK